MVEVKTEYGSTKENVIDLSRGMYGHGIQAECRKKSWISAGRCGRQRCPWLRNTWGKWQWGSGHGERPEVRGARPSASQWWEAQPGGGWENRLRLDCEGYWSDSKQLRFYFVGCGELLTVFQWGCRMTAVCFRKMYLVAGWKGPGRGWMWENQLGYLCSSPGKTPI